MAKRVTVIAVNPVNRLGLFHYLEAFLENGSPYKKFAVADTTQIKTNSGGSLMTDNVVTNLIGHEEDSDALIFVCSDAVSVFSDNVTKQYNQNMFAVMVVFASKSKLMIGHCRAAVFYDALGLVDGKKVTLQPFVKDRVQKGVATDCTCKIDTNFFTAQTKNTLHTLIPEIVKALK